MMAAGGNDLIIPRLFSLRARRETGDASDAKTHPALGELVVS